VFDILRLPCFKGTKQTLRPRVGLSPRDRVSSELAPRDNPGLVELSAVRLSLYCFFVILGGHELDGGFFYLVNPPSRSIHSHTPDYPPVDQVLHLKLKIWD
jgi:hypothetical protein